MDTCRALLYCMAITFAGVVEINTFHQATEGQFEIRPTAVRSER